MSSLPDEILSIILEYAAYCDKSHYRYEDESAIKTVKAATILSHVCRRFRQLVVRIPSLWNRIFNTMSPQMVSGCCDRLTIANAEVVLCNRSQQSVQFVHSVTNYSNYWRRYEHSTRIYSVDELLELAKATRNLDAPSLSELIIRHPTYSVGLIDKEHNQEVVHYYSTWRMPRLSSLIMENIIPIPFARPVSLRSLSIYMDYWNAAEGDQGWINMRALVVFIASCLVLEELTLNLSFASDISRLILPPKKHVSLDHVTEVTLTFEYCRSETIKSILDVVHFPNASSMKLKIRSENEPDSPDQQIDNVLLWIFPDVFTYPKLVVLHIQLGAFTSGTSVSLPFPSLSKVQHLELKTTNTVLAPLSDGSCLPALCSLVLKDCDKLESDWIALFLGRLMVQGNLQQSQLTVEGCRWKRSTQDLIPVKPMSNIAWDHWDDEGYEDVTADEMLQLVMQIR